MTPKGLKCLAREHIPQFDLPWPEVSSTGRKNPAIRAEGDTIDPLDRRLGRVGVATPSYLSDLPVRASNMPLPFAIRSPSGLKAGLPDDVLVTVPAISVPSRADQTWPPDVSRLPSGLKASPSLRPLMTIASGSGTRSRTFREKS